MCFLSEVKMQIAKVEGLIQTTKETTLQTLLEALDCPTTFSSHLRNNHHKGIRMRPQDSTGEMLALAMELSSRLLLRKSRIRRTIINKKLI